MERTALGKLSSWISSVFSSESLGELPETPVARGKQAFLSWLLKPETLPLDEPAARDEGPSLLSWFFSSELLPKDEGADRGARRPPFLVTLFSRENLPADAPRESVPGSRARRP